MRLEAERRRRGDTVGAAEMDRAERERDKRTDGWRRVRCLVSQASTASGELQ